MPVPDKARRTRLIKLIHVARRELGMADEDYRAMLAGMPALGGRTSSADLGLKGLELVLEALKAKGFRIRAKGPARAPSTRKAPSRKVTAGDSQSRMIRSLWIQLRDAGVLRDPSEAALASFVQRQTGVAALEWLNRDQAGAVIERLKKWLKRSSEGGGNER